MQPPSHDPKFDSSFDYAHTVARAALNRLAHRITCSSSIASDALMRLIGNHKLVVEGPSHMEALTTRSVEWALKDRRRRERALKRGGALSILSLDACDAHGGAFSPDTSIEFAAYLDTREEFNRRYARRFPESVRAVEAWFIHGRSVPQAARVTDLEEATVIASLTLFVNLFTKLETQARE